MNYYNNIDDCPLFKFRDKLKSGDLKHIHIDGDFVETDALIAWNQLYCEYVDSIESNKGSNLLEYIKQKSRLEVDYYIIKSLIELVQLKMMINSINVSCDFGDTYKIHDCQDEVKSLNKYMYNIDINNLESEIERVVKQSRNFETKIAAVQKKIKDEGEGSNDSINKTIFKAMRYQGIKWDADSKVRDLVDCINDMAETAAIIKANNKSDGK
jgi:hypothetical protein